jgi:outer membrane protein OmpA-like peptidoglycan-associated protein
VDHKAPHRFLLLLVSWVALASRFAASSSSGWRRRAEIKVVLLLQLNDDGSHVDKLALRRPHFRFDTVQLPCETLRAAAAQAPAPVPQPETDEAKQAADLETRANEKAKTELASLKSGFSAKDLIAALNDSVINFPSGSAEVPATTAAFLQNAVDDLKQLPAGHVLEIAGYTDNTGNPAENIALSQRRADAVRDALIKDGANPDTLVAKGYGSADPIASNDTPEGRLRNRRIEYHILKTP